MSHQVELPCARPPGTPVPWSAVVVSCSTGPLCSRLLWRPVELYQGLEGKAASIQSSHFAVVLNNLASRLGFIDRVDLASRYLPTGRIVDRRGRAELRGRVCARGGYWHGRSALL